MYFLVPKARAWAGPEMTLKKKIQIIKIRRNKKEDTKYNNKKEKKIS
jgi:hypothetical protein